MKYYIFPSFNITIALLIKNITKLIFPTVHLSFSFIKIR